MRPAGTRVLKRDQRRAWRGHKAGRRPSHQVAVTFGRVHQRREWDALMSVTFAALRKARDAE